MVTVEPVVGTPAAIAVWDDRRGLVVADYHAGLEAAMAYEDGVKVRSRAERRRERLLALVEEHDVTELIVVGDLMHSIGDPGYDERDELEALVAALSDDLVVHVIKGNHDGDLETWLGDVTVHEAPGVVLDGLAFSHGHTWPPAAALEADVLCIGHEHPQVALEDEVGGRSVRRAWLRGRLRAERIAAERGVDAPAVGPDLIVMPAFNELSGGTRVNVPEEDFLVPYLPEAAADAEAYLLDGTKLGRVLAPAAGDRGA